MRAFDQSGNVGNHKADLVYRVANSDHTEIRLECSERIIRNLRPSRRNARDEGRLANVGITNESNIGEQFQFKPVGMLFARPASLVFPRSLVHRGGKARIPAPSAASARDDEALSAIRTETEDRYGRIPEPVESLFAYARLRQTAEQLGIISIDRTRDGMAVKMAEKARVAPEKLMELVSQRSGSSFTPSGVLRLELDEEEKDHTLEVARRVLLQIRADG